MRRESRTTANVFSTALSYFRHNPDALDWLKSLTPRARRRTDATRTPSTAIAAEDIIHLIGRMEQRIPT